MLLGELERRSSRTSKLPHNSTVDSDARKSGARGSPCTLGAHQEGELQMNQTSILLPVMALMGWTFTVFLLIAYQRFKAVLTRKLAVHDFKFGESANVPGAVSIPNRNFMNLLELPVLFYVVCLALYVTQKTNSPELVLAWSYVSLRVIHSLVHLTYNKVVHRFAFYAASNIVLVLIWVRLLLELI